MRLFMILLLLMLCSCSTITTVTTPKGDVYRVSSKADAMVTLTEGDKTITVDNRGRPGMVEQALGIMFMNLPDVTISPD